MCIDNLGFSRFVGVGARRVRSLFHAAKKKVSSILLMDLKFLPLWIIEIFDLLITKSI